MLTPQQIRTVILSLLNKLSEITFKSEVKNLPDKFDISNFPETQKVEVINPQQIDIPVVDFSGVIDAIKSKVIPLDETATKQELLKELQAIKMALSKPESEDRTDDTLKAIERLIGAVLSLRKEDKEIDLSPIVNAIKQIDTTIDWSILEDVITKGEVKVKINGKQFEDLTKSLAKSISVAVGGGGAAITGFATETTLADIKISLQLIDNIVGSINGAGAPVIDSYTTKSFNLAAGANQSLVTAPGANKQIWVYGIGFTVNVAGTVSFQDEDDTAITGIMQIGATGGMTVAPSGNFAMPLWKIATNKALEVDVVTSELDGFLTYAIVSV